MDFKQYIDILHTHGADTAVLISPSDIELGAWTIMKCRYGCPAYGHNRCCPPYAPTVDETARILSCYNRALLFRSPVMDSVTSAALACAKALCSDGYYKALAFGAGPCRRCKECIPEHCPHPSETAPSPEACGIDVIATARKAGFEVHIPPIPGKPLSCFGIILIN